MIIESSISVHSPDSPTAVMQTRPELLFKVDGSVVRGVPPFLEEEHQITLAPGLECPVWHDGTAWRVGTPGWRASHAAHVVRWPALESLSTDTKYTLVAPRTRSEDVTLAPA